MSTPPVPSPARAGRPRLHLTAATGWINDPLGLTYRDGRYHLWFQHVPEQTQWAPSCHWGHATSPDLLHWTEDVVALAPGEGDGGCWSGSVVTDETGEARLFYTSVAADDFAVGRIRSARPTSAALGAWRKDAGVVAELPPGVAATTFRDPFVFAEGGGWWMLVGAGLADGTATALAYRSADLSSWEYTGPVASRHRDERDPVWTGAMWECPQLLRVGDRHLLVVSVWDADELHSVACAVGTFADGRFDAEAWHRLTWGPSYYAASAFRDRDGRPGLVFWLRGVADAAAGWSGAISLPYLVELDGDRPVLRPQPLAAVRAELAPAPCIEAVWRPGARGSRLRLHGDDRAEVARLTWDGDHLVVENPLAEAFAVPFGGGEVRVVLDATVLEVTAGGATGATAVPSAGDVRPEPDRPDDALTWWALRG